MKIRFIGDVHFGKRSSHSTKESAQRHAHLVDSVLLSVTDDFTGVILQLGDLFDSYEVNNTDFVRAAKAVYNIDGVLLGNHDRSNNTLHVPALVDLGKVSDDCTIVTEPLVSVLGDKQEVVVYSIPHMPTQGEFLKECDKALAFGKDFQAMVLMLHTNMYPEGFEGADIENNLSETLAKKLVEHFDLVISGHEHNGCTKHGVVMAGSIVPYGFGEMTNKRVVDFDTETKEISYFGCWDAVENFKSMTCQQFISIKDMLIPQFVEIVGEVNPENVLPMAKRIGQLFQTTDVLAIKNSCTVAKQQTDSESEQSAPTQDWKDFLKTKINEDQWELFQATLGELK